jgi:hypothetical protein
MILRKFFSVLRKAEAIQRRAIEPSCLIPPAQNPYERSLAHTALISDEWRRSGPRDREEHARVAPSAFSNCQA